jgi:hypothetical protein
LWWAGIAFGYVGLFHAWSYWIAGHSWGPLDRWLKRDAEFFLPYARGTLKQWTIVWAYTVVYYLFLFIGYYLAALAFEVYVPPLLFILLSPLALTLASLPVFFGGFGGTTLFWEAFFPDSGTPAAILALTLFIPLVRMLIRMVIGLGSLIPALPEVGLRGGKEST